MIYIVSTATLIMLGYMMWRASVRLRHDRVKTERQLTRGRHAFRPMDRIRFLLGRSFRLEDKAEWEEPLVSSLDKAAAERALARASAPDKPPGR